MKTLSLLLPISLTGISSATVMSNVLNFDNTGLDLSPDAWSISTPIDVASVGWDFSSVDNNTFTFGTSFVANSFRAYEVLEFSEFGINSIPSTSPIATNFAEPFINFDIPDGGSIFIALDISPDFPTEFRHFGWIEIENNGGTLTSPGNALTSNELGIIVGTTIAIPEPSTSALGLLFTVPLLARRRRNQRR